MRQWIPVISAAIIPGSGHVMLGRSMRGLIFVFWMIIFAYITYHLTSESISVIGRFSGGIAVWVISILEVQKISRLRRK
jgi:hypothetical protein